jgi:uncharacterized membrane protein
MSDATESRTCRNCGHHLHTEAPDNHGWCKGCRDMLVRRSGTWAIIPTLLVLAGYAYLLSYFGLFNSVFVIVWIALGAALGWVAFKVARRVLFDVIRGRGVHPPST